MTFVSFLKDNPFVQVYLLMVIVLTELVQTTISGAHQLVEFFRMMMHTLNAAIQALANPVLNGQGSTRDITAFVVIAATLFIGAYLLGMFIDVMPQLNETNPFFNIMNTIANTISSGYGILVIVLIVIAFVIIMAYLNRIGD